MDRVTMTTLANRTSTGHSISRLDMLGFIITRTLLVVFLALFFFFVVVFGILILLLLLFFLVVVNGISIQ